MRPLHRTPVRVAAATTIGISLTLAGCAEEGGERGGGGPGIEPGATMQEYQDAFADAEEIELRMQTPAPAGSPTGANLEAYAAAVTEWSGEKITFDIAYANAVADPTEADDALQDGRLDVASIVPTLEPSEFPELAALSASTVLSDHGPIRGVLQSNAWPNAVAAESEAIAREAEEHDLVFLLPWFDSGSDGLFCRDAGEDLAAFDGRSMRSPGAAQSTQVEGLGGSSVSLDYAELFEALERGVVDCAVASMTVGVLSGIIPEAPYAVFDPAAGFAVGMGTLAMSRGTWEELPLLAQQLLWDRADVLVEANITQKIWPNIADALTQVETAGGEVVPFADDAREAMQEVTDALLDDLAQSGDIDDGAALVEAARTASDAWSATLEDLGYESRPYGEFADVAVDDIDLGPYLDAFTEELRRDGRPS